MQETSQRPDAFTQWHADSVQYRDLIEQMLRFPKPIIAAVNGPAVAGGVATGERNGDCLCRRRVSDCRNESGRGCRWRLAARFSVGFARGRDLLGVLVA